MRSDNCFVPLSCIILLLQTACAMGAASWMQFAAGSSEDLHTALTNAKELLTRCRALIERLKGEASLPRSASSDKCLVFCLLLVRLLCFSCAEDLYCGFQGCFHGQCYLSGWQD